MPTIDELLNKGETKGRTLADLQDEVKAGEEARLQSAKGVTLSDLVGMAEVPSPKTMEEAIASGDVSPQVVPTQRSWSDVTAGSTAYGLAEMGRSISSLTGKITDIKTLENVSGSLEDFKRSHPEWAPEQVHNVWELVSSPKALSSHLFSNSAQMLTGMGMMKIPKVGVGISAMLNGSLSGNSMYENALASGATHEQALSSGLKSAAVATLMDTAEQAQLFRTVSGQGRRLEMVAQNGTTSVMKIVAGSEIKRAVKDAAYLGTVNAMQTAIDNGIALSTFGQPINGGMDSALQSFALGGLTSLAFGEPLRKITLGFKGPPPQEDIKTLNLDIYDKMSTRNILKLHGFDESQVAAIGDITDAFAATQADRTGLDKEHFYAQVLSPFIHGQPTAAKTTSDVAIERATRLKQAFENNSPQTPVEEFVKQVFTVMDVKDLNDLSLYFNHDVKKPWTDDEMSTVGRTFLHYMSRADLAPSPHLADAFGEMRDLFRRTYKDMKHITNNPVPAEVKSVFDRLLSVDSEEISRERARRDDLKKEYAELFVGLLHIPAKSLEEAIWGQVDHMEVIPADPNNPQRSVGDQYVMSKRAKTPDEIKEAMRQLATIHPTYEGKPPVAIGSPLVRNYLWNVDGELFDWATSQQLNHMVQNLIGLHSAEPFGKLKVLDTKNFTSDQKVVNQMMAKLGVHVAWTKNLNQVMSASGIYHPAVPFTLMLDVPTYHQNPHAMISYTLWHEFTHVLQEHHPEALAPIVEQMTIENVNDAIRLYAREGTLTQQFTDMIQERLTRKGTGAIEAEAEFVSQYMMSNPDVFSAVLEKLRVQGSPQLYQEMVTRINHLMEPIASKMFDDRTEVGQSILKMIDEVASVSKEGFWKDFLTQMGSSAKKVGEGRRPVGEVPSEGTPKKMSTLFFDETIYNEILKSLSFEPIKGSTYHLDPAKNQQLVASILAYAKDHGYMTVGQIVGEVERTLNHTASWDRVRDAIESLREKGLVDLLDTKGGEWSADLKLGQEVRPENYGNSMYALKQTGESPDWRPDTVMPEDFYSSLSVPPEEAGVRLYQLKESIKQLDAEISTMQQGRLIPKYLSAVEARMLPEGYISEQLQIENPTLAKRNAFMGPFVDYIRHFYSGESIFAPFKSGKVLFQGADEVVNFATSMVGNYSLEMDDAFVQLKGQRTELRALRHDHVFEGGRYKVSGLRVLLSPDSVPGTIQSTTPPRQASARIRNLSWKINADAKAMGERFGMLTRFLNGAVEPNKGSDPNRMLLIPTPEFRRAIKRNDGNVLNPLIDILYDTNPELRKGSEKQVKKSIKENLEKFYSNPEMLSGPDTEKANKLFGFIPDVIRRNQGGDIRLFETDPLDYMYKAALTQFSRVGWAKTFGVSGLNPVSLRQATRLTEVLGVRPVMDEVMLRQKLESAVKRGDIDAPVTMDHLNMDQLKEVAKREGVDLKPDREQLFSAVEKVTGTRLTPDQQKQVRQFAREFKGVDTSLPINTLLSEVKSRIREDQGNVFETLLDQLQAEGGNRDRAKQWMSLALGVPIADTPFNSVMRLTKLGSTVLGVLQTSLAGARNVPQTIIAGMRHPLQWAEALQKVILNPETSHAQIQALGALPRVVRSLGIEKGRVYEDIGRAIGYYGGKVTGLKFMAERNNVIMGQFYRQFAVEWRGDPTNISRRDVREMEFIGLSKEDIGRIKGGKMDDLLFAKIVQQGVANAEFVTTPGHRRGAVENNPWGGLLFSYLNYHIGMGRFMAKGLKYDVFRPLTDGIKSFGKGLATGDIREVGRGIQDVASGVWGATALGVGLFGAGWLSRALVEALRGDDHRDVDESMRDKIVGAMFEAGFIGPHQRLVDAWRYGKGSDWIYTIMPQVSVAKELLTGTVNMAAKAFGFRAQPTRFAYYDLVQMFTNPNVKDVPMVNQAPAVQALFKWIDLNAYPKMAIFDETRVATSKWMRENEKLMTELDVGHQPAPSNPWYDKIGFYVARGDVETAQKITQEYYDFSFKQMEKAEDPIMLEQMMEKMTDGLRTNLLSKAPIPLSDKNWIRFMGKLSDERFMKYLEADMEYRFNVDFLTLKSKRK